MAELRPVDQFQFHHELERTPGVALVYFGAAGCGACRALRRALSEARDERGAATVFMVDAERDLALVREFDVFHLPVLFVYRAGRFHRPLHCQPAAAALRAALDRALLEPAEEAP